MKNKANHEHRNDFRDKAKRTALENAEKERIAKEKAEQAAAAEREKLLACTRPQKNIRAAGLSGTYQVNGYLVFATPEASLQIKAKNQDGKEILLREIPVRKAVHPGNALPEVSAILPESRFEAIPLSYNNKYRKKFLVERSPFTKSDGSYQPLAVFDDPGYYGRKDEGSTAVRQDLLGLKAELEQKYYGRTFPDDNIHIQIIYNILDIDKIITPYVNNIVATLNRLTTIEEHDFLGMLYLRHTYSDFTTKTDKDFSKISYWDNLKRDREIFENYKQNPETTCFGTALYNFELEKDEIELKKKHSAGKIPDAEFRRSLICLDNQCRNRFRKNYYILWLLGLARQSLAHSRDGDNLYLLDYAENNPRLMSYMKDVGPEALSEALKELDSIYTDKITGFNEEFIKTSAKNMAILFSVLEYDSKEGLVRDYYRYAAAKEYRNMGFSVKTLREIITHQLFVKERRLGNEQIFSTLRRKYNTIMDFLIWKYYTSEKGRTEADAFIEKLRGKSVRKGQKNEIRLRDLAKEEDLPKDNENLNLYIEEANRLYAIDEADSKISEGCLASRINAAIRYISSTKIKALGDDSIVKEFESIKLESVIKGQPTHKFSEMMYLLTLFLDGKEINLLLTQLINKLDNISALQGILDKLTEVPGDDGEPILKDNPHLAERFALFSESSVVSRELRTVNSFARMTQPIKGYMDPTILKNAIKLLGFSGDEKELDQFIYDYFLNTINKKALDNRKSKTDKKDTGYSNFIKNNVINNSRFLYLMRYGKPEELHRLASNKALVLFVLNDIPDTQLERYRITLMLDKSYQNNREKIVGELADRISKFSAENEELFSIRVGTNNQTKEKQKALVSLYLTVLYLIVKNLININYRYYMAFSIVERDAEECGLQIKQGKISHFEVVTENYLEKPNQSKQGSSTKRFNQYLNADKQYIKDNFYALARFRNHVEHLSVIHGIDKYSTEVGTITSYFALYHYIMQRTLAEDIKNHHYENVYQFYEDYLANVRGTYCKDAVKKLCFPFGYNLARYKNLSIEGLFDKDRPIPIERKDEIPDVEYLYHGTTVPSETVEKIMKEGLIGIERTITDSATGKEKKERIPILLTSDSEYAGRERKHGKPTAVFKINVKLMATDGMKFYRDYDRSFKPDANHDSRLCAMWSTEKVPAKYIELVKSF